MLHPAHIIIHLPFHILDRLRTRPRRPKDPIFPILHLVHVPSFFRVEPIRLLVIYHLLDLLTKHGHGLDQVILLIFPAFPVDLALFRGETFVLRVLGELFLKV
jgi:hypothetical protein